MQHHCGTTNAIRILSASPPLSLSHVCPRLLQQPPTALFVNAVRIEQQHRRHLVVVHLVVDVEVALLPATFDATIRHAPLQHTTMPADGPPMEEDGLAHKRLRCL